MRNEIIIYNVEHDKIGISLHKKDGTVWLNQAEIAELFQTTKQNISKHIKNIFNEGELKEEKVIEYKLTIIKAGTNEKQKKTKGVAYYNLDMILAIGYRVRSGRSIRFRQYANTVLKEYLVKGFAMNDEQLKNMGDNNYFKQLLERIRDIRSSEKVFYRQVLDLFATSADYNSLSHHAKKFFSTVQNKMHYAIHKHTACELIHERVDSEKEFMGLTVFKGELPTKQEAETAKNYLTEKELKGLNQLVSGYLDFAERQAEKEIPMTMQDWINHVDAVLEATGEAILKDNGKVSREQMQKKVHKEYKKFHKKTLSSVEKDYLREIKSIEKMAKKGTKS